MGLFDNLRCDYPLPGYEGRLFQTKSFPDPYLRMYIITADGRLIVHAMNDEEVPEEERPGYAEYLRTGQAWHLLAGSVRAAPPFDQDVNFHGDVVFYDDAFHDDVVSYDDATFRARFSNGQLESIAEILSAEEC